LSLRDIENLFFGQYGRLHCLIGRIERPVAVVRRRASTNTESIDAPLDTQSGSKSGSAYAPSCT
jgi:hypothetical protein